VTAVSDFLRLRYQMFDTEAQNEIIRVTLAVIPFAFAAAIGLTWMEVNEAKRELAATQVQRPEPIKRSITEESIRTESTEVSVSNLLEDQAGVESKNTLTKRMRRNRIDLD